MTTISFDNPPGSPSPFDGLIAAINANTKAITAMAQTLADLQAAITAQTAAITANPPVAAHDFTPEVTQIEANTAAIAGTPAPAPAPAPGT